MPKDKKPGLYERNKGKIIGAGITTALNAPLLFDLAKFFYKDGGRVRGVGKATHGYGKAMKKQGKK